MVPVVPPVVVLLAVPVFIVPPAVPGVVEPGIVDPDADPRVRLRPFDTLCGSVDVVEPFVLVGEFA